MIPRRLVDAAFVTCIADSTEKEVGLSDVPSEYPTLPYGVVSPWTAPPGTGSWASPEEDQYFAYQVISVGETSEQCAWMSDAFHDAIILRAGKGWENDITIEDAAVINRETVSRGAIVRTGETLFQVSDLYQLTVGAS